MELIQAISLIGPPLFGILIDIAYAQLKNNTPYIKRIWAWLVNKKYKVHVRGVKTYSSFDYDIGFIKKELHKEYKYIKSLSTGKNYMIILIKNMQAPYKISFLPIPNENDNFDDIEVIIELEGTVSFSYRSKHENNKYLTVLDNLFKIIERKYNQYPSTEIYTLEADTQHNFEDKPFMSEYKSVECEDTQLEMDKETNFLKINSKSIYNINKCLDKHIQEII